MPHSAPTGKTSLVDELDALKTLLDGASHAVLSPEAEQRCVRIAREVSSATSRLVPQLAIQWALAYPSLQALVWGAYLQLLPTVSWAAAPPKDAVPTELFEQLSAYRVELDAAKKNLSDHRGDFDQILGNIKSASGTSLALTAEVQRAFEVLKASAWEGEQFLLQLQEGAKHAAARSAEASSDASAAKASPASAAEEAAAAKGANVAVLAASKSIASVQLAALKDATAAASAAGASAEAAKEATGSATAAKASLIEGSGAATAIMETKPKIDELLALVTASAVDTAKAAGEVERHAGSAAIDAEVAQKAVKAVHERLRVATSIGLAAAFSKRARNLQIIGGIWAVVLIGALVGSWWLGSQRVSSLLESLQHADKYSPTTLWIQLAVTIFSVGAPIWLAWLSTPQVTHNFRLAEDYGYKATISQAYEGYRKEAVDLDPVFQARLFASALSRLDENPLRLLSDYTPGSPLQDLFSQPWFQQALQTVPDLKKGMIDWLQSTGKVVQKPVEAVADKIVTSSAEGSKPAVTLPPTPTVKAQG